MKKIVLTAAVLISLLGFTACEQSPTEVTVQAPSQASEFKEVKWIGYPLYDNYPSHYQYVSGCLKLNGIDSVTARYGFEAPIQKFGTKDAAICEYIKIKINEAESYSSEGAQGDVTVLYKIQGNNTECVQLYRYYTYQQDAILQWEYK